MFVGPDGDVVPSLTESEMREVDRVAYASARIVSPSPRAAPPRNGYTAPDSGGEHLSRRGQSYDSPDRPSIVLGTAMMAHTVGTIADSSHFLVLADQNQINQADE